MPSSMSDFSSAVGVRPTESPRAASSEGATEDGLTTRKPSDSKRLETMPLTVSSPPKRICRRRGMTFTVPQSHSSLEWSGRVNRPTMTRSLQRPRRSSATARPTVVSAERPVSNSE